MKYLLISICLICIGCASYPKRNSFQEIEISDTRFINPYFSDKTQDYVYKANISIFKKHFGGILIIKKINDTSHRIAFTTEMGNKIFDFSFTGTDFKVNHILEEFNKKILIAILKKDFKVLIQEKLIPIQTYTNHKSTIVKTEINNSKHYYYLTNQKINKIARVGGGKEKVVFTFSEINDTIANRIIIEHKGIKLKINLKSI